MKPAVVYISYDGMLEPLGQSQVLAYLEHLRRGYDVHLISFEKKNDWRDKVRMAAMKERTAASGIAWYPQAYHKYPSAPATAFDIFMGTMVAIWLVVRHRALLVHVRSYVPAAMGLVATKVTGAKFLFDIRGFWADERVDGGLWKRDSALYRVTKRLERHFFRSADHIVALTDASKREIENFAFMSGRHPAISVIPTCADLDRFRRTKPKEAGSFVLGYVGSVGTWYLFDEVVACFKLILERHKDAKLLVVNRNEHDLIRRTVIAGGVDLGRLELVSAEHAQVPQFIERMDAGIAIIKPVYSKIASAPTKLAEYLGCGVPCLGNTNVGDMAQILESRQVGVAVDAFTDSGRRNAVERLFDLIADPKTPSRCEATARELFSLESGVARYRSIYERLTAPQRSEKARMAEMAEE
ncbi:MAG: glycosyltransferase [Alphaproteobacteria bacterium]|nr:glycosyltransferase [Alphaproteobacteria bacterium]